jgi:polar amino acid transport system substrate-binding protein
MSARPTSPVPLSRAWQQHRRWLCVLAGLWLGGSSGAWAEPAVCKTLVASGNPQYPPYLWRDPADESRLVGANADLMQRLAQELGVTIEIRYVGPWGRVQEEAKTGRIDLIAGAFWTQPRTEYMDYFTPAFHQTRSVIWVNAKSRLLYRQWSDLVGQQGVTVINNSFGEAFDRYARQALKITQVASLEQAIQMLQRGRADYLIYEDSPGQAFLAKLDIQGVRMLTPAVANEALHLTLAHKSPCNTGELRGRIARALHKLAGANPLPELLDKNIQLWRLHSPNVK